MKRKVDEIPMFQYLKTASRKSSIGNNQSTIFNRESQIVNRKLSICRNNAAFTIIELIVAITLASMIILITAMIFKQASSAFSESDARNEVYQNVRAAFDVIKRDISGATLNANREWFKGELNTITFLSSTSNNNDQPITLIKYFLQSNTLNKSENTDTAFLNAGMSAFGTATTTGIMGFNVSSLQFRYYDMSEASWANTWDCPGTNTAILPDAVEVKMTVSDMRNRYTGTSTSIIAIP
ncbi:MAG: prepilin-type N-terminal cleavage/methylation domain-containing protein [Planctomycetota bacterium]